jgi:outer membrane receptor protein involved in Fe transport
MEFGNSRRHRQGSVSALLLLLATSLFGSAAWAAGPNLYFNIPAGDALKTLPQFISQSKIEMLYLTDSVRGLQTHAISGDLEASDALRQMLEGTHLQFEFDSDYSFASIKLEEKRPELIGPPTALAGIALSAARDERRDSLDILKQTFGAEQKLEEVVVTGTLIHGVLDIMSPLTFVTRNEMKKTSYATVQDALQTLPVNFGGGPSEDFNAQGNFGRGVSANLRGLGAGATLVLVNGRRQPFSGTQGDFVDVSNIPWSAVDRIEILPDGASALYGSDAIAGVINVIMRKDIEGAESQARIGAAPGGASERLVSHLFGREWDGGNALLSYQFSERTALAAAERAYAANTDKRSLGGTDHRSFRSSPGNILDPSTLLPAYGIPAAGDDNAVTLADLRPNDINLQNRYSSMELLPDRRMHNLFFSGSQHLSDRAELFAEARYSKRDISQQLYAFDQVVVVPSTNPFAVNPYASSPYVLVGYSFLNDLGPIVLTAGTQTYGATVGVKTEIASDWRVTLSGSYGREGTNYTTYNQPDPTALDAALADKDPATAFNPFSSGATNRATLDAVRTTQRGRAVSSITGATFIADGPVAKLPTGPVRLAVGGEWRNEGFAHGLSALNRFERTVESAFAELSVPIIGNADDLRAVPRLELSLAGRYESYSDFGTTSNPKIGLRWAPSDSVKLRTSWGTSFRAPKLVDIYDTSQNLALLAPLRDPQAASGISVILARLGNNPDLKEETATTWTAGIDLAPASARGLSLSLTYYAIDYEHRILAPGLASPFDILLQEDQWGAVITRKPLQSDIDAICASPVFSGPVAQCSSVPVAAIIDYRVRNLAATRIKGLDLRIDRSLDTRYGTFSFGLNGGYILSFEQAVSNTSPRIDIVDTVGNPLSLRLRGTVEWYQHDWEQQGPGVSLTVNHSGGYTDTENQARRSVDALTTLDVRLGYRTASGDGLLDSVELGLNAANVFNRAPPFLDREMGYDAQNTEPYGRVLSLTLQKKW